MEDIFKFLFVVGIFALDIVRQSGKKRKPVPATSRKMPMPEPESPFPENPTLPACYAGRRIKPAETLRNRT